MLGWLALNYLVASSPAAPRLRGAEGAAWGLLEMGGDAGLAGAQLPRGVVAGRPPPAGRGGRRVGPAGDGRGCWAGWRSTTSWRRRRPPPACGARRAPRGACWRWEGMLGWLALNYLVASSPAAPRLRGAEGAAW